MKGFYNLTDKLKEALLAEPFVNTVTFGSLDDIDLNKQTIFPLSHIIVNNTTVGSKTLTFNVSILAMDIVDESKEATTDIFRGNNNEQDILNTQLAVLNKLVMVLRKGALYSDQYQLDGDATLEPFYERFDNRLAGWSATFDVFVKNDISIC